MNENRKYAQKKKKKHEWYRQSKRRTLKLPTKLPKKETNIKWNEIKWNE